MIKVPATPAGIPAIQELIGEGINVKKFFVTLVAISCMSIKLKYLRGNNYYD
ncbi:transaldolase (plasmid) [Scytonema sp. HK-05]|uniref:transaldolase family protein n=1 Tax=Scytonema sp. HK-05 TaxID=1137095 RepID=UPI000ABFE5A5|nr:transaldolase family protein [Scytonema sp. HK-05]BAY50099.1 transaldolase [Scytonema sp. HK-05]